jgi:pimeloyl-ACP methyl ester carboxylesterase
MSTSGRPDWSALHERYPPGDGKTLELPDDWRRVEYPSRADGSNQGAWFYAPPGGGGPSPLLVALHPWSSDQDAYHRACALWCIDNGWAALAPDFRGANDKPAACASQLVVEDILSAVAWARGRSAVDPRRVYLVGTSGGGHAALLMAGRAPRVWAGVSAWAPISDLAAWHRQQSEATGPKGGYAAAIEKCCDGAPGASPAVDEEYRKRSPLTWLPGARGLALDINAGIRDGHEGSVPVSHSLNAFNAVAAGGDRIAEGDIRHMTGKAEVPPRLRAEIDDPSYGKKVPLFRRVSGPSRVTIFDGGHELVAVAALTWLQQQTCP